MKKNENRLILALIFLTLFATVAASSNSLYTLLYLGGSLIVPENIVGDFETISEIDLLKYSEGCELSLESAEIVLSEMPPISFHENEVAIAKLSRGLLHLSPYGKVDSAVQVRIGPLFDTYCIYSNGRLVGGIENEKGVSFLRLDSNNALISDSLLVLKRKENSSELGYVTQNGVKAYRLPFRIEKQKVSKLIALRRGDRNWVFLKNDNQKYIVAIEIILENGLARLSFKKKESFLGSYLRFVGRKSVYDIPPCQKENSLFSLVYRVECNWVVGSNGVIPFYYFSSKGQKKGRFQNAIYIVGGPNGAIMPSKRYISALPLLKNFSSVFFPIISTSSEANSTDNFSNRLSISPSEVSKFVAEKSKSGTSVIIAESFGAQQLKELIESSLPLDFILLSGVNDGKIKSENLFEQKVEVKSDSSSPDTVSKNLENMTKIGNELLFKFELLSPSNSDDFDYYGWLRNGENDPVDLICKRKAKSRLVIIHAIEDHSARIDLQKTKNLLQKCASNNILSQLIIMDSDYHATHELSKFATKRGGLINEIVGY